MPYKGDASIGEKVNMAIEGLLTAAILVRSVTTPRAGGPWQVIAAYIASRKAIALERGDG